MIPAWYQVGLEELGQAEAPGKRENPRIAKYHSFTGLAAVTEVVPWCGSFIAYCMAMSKIPYRRNTAASAADWLLWGKPLKAPILGAVGVKAREGGNHVVMFSKWIDKKTGTIQVLEGNASNRVQFGTYDVKVFKGWRWPTDVPIPMAATPLKKSGVTIGGTITAGAGTLVSADALAKLSSPENIATANTAIETARSIREQMTTSAWLGLALGILIVGVAGLIIYVRWQGTRKDRIVAGEIA